MAVTTSKWLFMCQTIKSPHLSSSHQCTSLDSTPIIISFQPWSKASCPTAHIDPFHDICNKNLLNRWGKGRGCCLPGFSKALGTVSHSVLDKAAAGVWFAGWRPGCLAGHSHSEWSLIQLVAVTSGTPQDSVLGPVLTFLSTTLLKGSNAPPESSWMTPS